MWGPDGPLDRTPYAASFALTAAAEFVAELAEALEEMGIRPEQVHAEVGHGNLELSVGEAEALAAADRRVMVLEAIRGVAHGMGLQTTMAPKPYLDQAGNGHHLHLSLYALEDDSPVLFDASGKLSAAGSGFVGGLLEHLPAVMAFTAPSPNSYQRLAPGMWSSAYAAYGPDNREAAVRLTSPMAGAESATANVEFKPMDVTANPYLALTAVLVAGMDGVERDLDPGEPATVDPATLSDDERASRGTPPPCPPPSTRPSTRWRATRSPSGPSASRSWHPPRRGPRPGKDGEGPLARGGCGFGGHDLLMPRESRGAAWTP